MTGATKTAFGTIRIFGVIGRAMPYIALGFAIYDLVTIGMCAMQDRHA